MVSAAPKVPPKPFHKKNNYAVAFATKTLFANS